MSGLKCCEVGCSNEGTSTRTIEDNITGRMYHIFLCMGHAAEYDTYHRLDKESKGE